MASIDCLPLRSDTIKAIGEDDMKKIIGILFAIAATVVATTICLNNAGLIDWNQVAKFAPVATETVAVCAGLIALFSISVQRDVAKKKATVDLFAKTEMDEKMLVAYDNFLKAIHALKISNSPEVFCTYEKTTEDYLAIRKYLNVFELIAVGIKNDIFDDDICFEFFGAILTYSYSECKPVVDYIRTRPRNRYTYTQLDELHADWSRRIAKANKKAGYRP